MLEAARGGSIEMLYLAGTDVLAMYGDESFAREALSRLKLLIVQDLFITESARLAHVVLPGAALAEKDGTLTNQEGRVQATKRIANPPGQAKTDLEIFSAFGNCLDGAFPAKADHAALFDEIRLATGTYAGVSLLFNNKKTKHNGLDNKEALVMAAAAKIEASSDFKAEATAGPQGYPFILVTGNHLFHSGRVSRKSESLMGLLKEAIVEISEEDAARLGLSSGQKVKVRGKNYEASLLLRTRQGTKSGVAFIPENFESAPVNRFFKRGEGLQRVAIEKSY